MAEQDASANYRLDSTSSRTVVLNAGLQVHC